MHLTDANGLDEEIDGMTILALILWRIRTHYKVDMYSEIGAQYDNNINLFFDSVKSVKLQIDSKDPTAYTDQAVVRDIFVQLKNELLPHDFKSEFTSLERYWQMGKEIVTSQSLMDDASTYYTNMVASGRLKKEFNKTKAAKNAIPASNTFEMWRLEKVDNKEEFNMVVKDGKTYYWCDKHKYPSYDVQGMCVFHKPADHGKWLERKTALNGQRGKGGKEKDTNSRFRSNSQAIFDTGRSKIVTTLTTTTGLTDDQFTKIWDNCCSALGN